MNISEKIKELETKIFKTNNNSQKHFILAKYLELLENPELSFFILEDEKMLHYICRRLTCGLCIHKSKFKYNSKTKDPWG